MPDDSTESHRGALLTSAATIPCPVDEGRATGLDDPDDGWMSMMQLQEFCGNVSRSAIYRWIGQDFLPDPVRLGTGKVFFSRREVREKLAKRPRSVIRKSKVPRAADQAA
jgi:predicted DNA-binding transcriptional regulator AlpA